MAENDLDDLYKKRMQANEEEAAEDEAVLSEDDGEGEENVAAAIVDNGQFDYDLSEGDLLNFHPGSEIAKHFPELTPELIDKYGDALEDVYKRSMAANVFFKSLSDQITQKGRNVSDDFTKERSILEKALELKLEIAFVKGVELDPGVEAQVIGSLVEKSFGRSEVKKDATGDKILEKLAELSLDLGSVGRAVARRKKGDEH